MKLVLGLVAFGLLMAYPELILTSIEAIANWEQSWKAIWLAASVVPVSTGSILVIAWALS